MPFTISVGHAQRDGRRYVTEVHSDGQGEYARPTYLAAEGTDYTAVATAREVRLIESLGQQEARDAVDEQRVPSTRFATIDEILAEVRARYLQSVGEETCRIAKWVVERLNDSTINTTQCQDAWGVSSGGWNAINGRMDTFAAAIDSVDTAVGE